MPRTRTIKKGNRKGNRNVSRGNKYTLNRLKERNHKRKKTRLRRGSNRNNYNNLPKRTRKQRAGAGMARRGFSALARGTSKLTKGTGNLINKGVKKIGTTIKKSPLFDGTVGLLSSKKIKDRLNDTVIKYPIDNEISIGKIRHYRAEEMTKLVNTEKDETIKDKLNKEYYTSREKDNVPIISFEGAPIYTGTSTNSISSSSKKGTYLFLYPTKDSKEGNISFKSEFLDTPEMPETNLKNTSRNYILHSIINRIIKPNISIDSSDNHDVKTLKIMIDYLQKINYFTIKNFNRLQINSKKVPKFQEMLTKINDEIDKLITNTNSDVAVGQNENKIDIDDNLKNQLTSFKNEYLDIDLSPYKDDKDLLISETNKIIIKNKKKIKDIRANLSAQKQQDRITKLYDEKSVETILGDLGLSDSQKTAFKTYLTNRKGEFISKIVKSDKYEYRINLRNTIKIGKVLVIEVKVYQGTKYGIKKTNWDIEEIQNVPLDVIQKLKGLIEKKLEVSNKEKEFYYFNIYTELNKLEINSENTGSFSEEMSPYFSELIFSAYANQSKKYIEIHEIYDHNKVNVKYVTLHSFIEMKKIMNKNDELIMDEKALITFKQKISSRLQDVYNQLGNLGIYLDLTTSRFKKIFIKIPQTTKEEPDFKITYFGNAKLDHDKFFKNFNDPAKLIDSLKTDIKNLFPAASDFTKNKICRYFSDKPNLRKVEQVPEKAAPAATQNQAGFNKLQANLLKSVEGLNTNVAEKAQERPPPPPPPPPPPAGAGSGIEDGDNVVQGDNGGPPSAPAEATEAAVTEETKRAVRLSPIVDEKDSEKRLETIEKMIKNKTLSTENREYIRNEEKNRQQP